jgi:hypothetical protein
MFEVISYYNIFAFLRLAKVPYLTLDDIKWFVIGKTFIKTMLFLI